MRKLVACRFAFAPTSVRLPFNSPHIFSPSRFLRGVLHFIVPPSTVQNKCQATLANVYALPESDIIGNTYNYGYGVTDWPFPATIQMDGSQRGDPAHGPEQTNGNLVVNIYVRYDYSTLDPGSVYVINLLCPPVPPPSDTYD